MVGNRTMLDAECYDVNARDNKVRDKPHTNKVDVWHALIINLLEQGIPPIVYAAKVCVAVDRPECILAMQPRFQPARSRLYL